MPDNAEPARKPCRLSRPVLLQAVHSEEPLTSKIITRLTPAGHVYPMPAVAPPGDRGADRRQTRRAVLRSA
jgi:hypothetical protein